MSVAVYTQTENMLEHPANEISLSQVRKLFDSYCAKLAPFLTGAQRDWLRETTVNLNTRMRSALGRAYLQYNRIELNLRLLRKHPEELPATLAHELAHLVAPLLYGRRGLNHSEGWQKAMELLGFAPERTHSLDVDELKNHHRVAAWATCGCPGRRHPIRTRVLNKMRRRYRYACLRCKRELRLEA
jgi:SprT protein